MTDKSSFTRSSSGAAMRRGHFGRILFNGAVCLACAGCGASFPEVPTVRQPPIAYDPVPYPPPTVLVEVVPQAPREDALWVDGGWSFRAGRWTWNPGGWVVLPRGTRLRPWNVIYLSDGSIAYAPSTWVGPEGRPQEAPAVLAPANPSPDDSR